MFGRKKRELTQEEKELNIAKDFFWMIFMVELITIPPVLTFLADHNALNLSTEIPLGLLFAFFLSFGPGFLYRKMRGLYSAFTEEGYKDKSMIKSSALIYNMVYFVVLSFIAYYIALAVSYFIFGKHTFADYVFIVIFNLGALYLSKKLTDRKVSKYIKED